MQSEEKDQTQTQDNKDEIIQNIPTEEEQQKIIAEIAKEEVAAFQDVQRQDQDAIFLEDNPVKALEKLLSLSESNFNERLVYVKHLAELLNLLGDDGVKNLGSILEIILKDSDEIKRSLISQIETICKQYESRQDYLDILKTHLVPCLTILLGYDNLDIKEQAGNELAKIASQLTEEDRGILILKKIIQMAHDEQSEENKIVASQLFGKLAATMGQQLSESFVSLEILSMGEDIRQRVRKEVVYQISNVGKAVSQQFFVQRLLPFYLQYYLNYYSRKCEEKTWQIRKASAEIITDISNVCPLKIREDQLAKQMLSLLKDQNKWVKGSAFKSLPSFLETFTGSQQPNPQLLNEYCRVTASDIKECYSDEYELLRVCAFYFPAVLQAYGASKWPQLQKLFNLLLKINDKQVKKPLACSLHEIAKIIGPQQAEKDLIVVLDTVLKDKDEEVKYGAIKNLWKFIEIFGPKRRESLLDVFLILQKDQKKWRIRELIAKQIDCLASIFDAEIVFKIIVPITLKLCNDVVAQVRKQAANKVYSLISSFQKDTDELSEIYKQCVLENIKAFAVSTRFNQRQAFARMCKNLMNVDEKMFEACFMDSLTSLSKDPVKNVRITVAQVVSKHMKKQGKLANTESLQKLIQEMKQDTASEISQIFS